MNLLWRQLGAEMQRCLGPALATTVILAAVAIATAHVTQTLLPGTTISALLPVGTRVYEYLNYANVLEVVGTLAASLPALLLSADLSDDIRAVTLVFPVGSVRLVLLRTAVGYVWPVLWTAGGLAVADVLGMPFAFTRDLFMLIPESMFMFTLVLAAAEASGQLAIGAGAAVGATVFGAGIPGNPLPQLSDYWELFCARAHLPGPLLWENRLVLSALALVLIGFAMAVLALRRGRGTYAP